MRAGNGGAAADPGLTAADLAQTHAASGIGPRAWSAAEFAALLDDPTIRLIGDVRAFALGRVILDESEVLTLATHPDHRRQGHGRSAMTGLLEALAAAGASRIFLEVAADNHPALNLYRQLGFAGAGRRPGYYGGVDALILVRDLCESGGPDDRRAG